MFFLGVINLPTCLQWSPMYKDFAKCEIIGTYWNPIEIPERDWYKQRSFLPASQSLSPKCSPTPRAIGIGHLCLKTSTLRDWRPPAIFRNGGWNLFSTAPVIHLKSNSSHSTTNRNSDFSGSSQELDSKPLADLTHEIGVTQGFVDLFSCGMMCTKRCLWWRYMKYMYNTLFRINPFHGLLVTGKDLWTEGYDR